jgi:hypothetical protein
MSSGPRRNNDDNASAAAAVDRDGAVAGPAEPPLSFERQLQALQVNAMRDGVESERMIREAMLKKVEAEIALATAGRLFGTETGSIVACGGAAEPRLVKPDRNAGIRRLACGAKSTVALSKDGGYYTWLDGTASLYSRRQQAPGGVGIVQVSAGKGFGLFLTANHHVYYWMDDALESVAQVPDFADGEDEVIALHAGLLSDVWLARTKKGALIKFGNKNFKTLGTVEFEMLGRNAYKQELIPPADRSHSSHGVVDAAVGTGFLLAVVLDKSNRYVTLSAGSNQFGQLGHGSADENQLNVELTVVRFCVYGMWKASSNFSRVSGSHDFLGCVLPDRGPGGRGHLSSRNRERSCACLATQPHRCVRVGSLQFRSDRLRHNRGTLRLDPDACAL